MSLNHVEYQLKKELAYNKIRALDTILKGVSLRKNLKASFEKFGLSKGTWSAVRMLPAARSLFSETPSMESLNAIGTTAAELVEEPDGFNSSIIADAIELSSHSVLSFIDIVKDRFTSIYNSISSATETFEVDGEVDGNKVVSDLPYATKLARIERFSSAINELVSDSVITSLADAVNLISKEIDPKSKIAMGDLTHVAVDELTEATLGELGYDKETILELSNRYLDLLEQLGRSMSKVKSVVKDKSTLEAPETLVESDDDDTDFDLPEIDTVSPETVSVSLEENNEFYKGYLSAVVSLLDGIGHLGLLVLNTLTAVTPVN